MQKKHENRIELTCSNPNIFETYFCRPLDISY